jgi:hypothetical protein
MVKLVKIIENDPKTKSTTYLADDGNTYVLKGDLSARANNPGNISPTGKKARGVSEQQYGAIGYLPSSNGPPVAVFPDFESGNAAQVYLWQTPTYQKKTVEQAARSWAATPYVDALVNAAGVSRDTPVSSLTPEQLSAIISTQAGQEGSSKLSITGPDGQPVPFELAQSLGAVPRPPKSIPGAASALDTGLSRMAGGVAPPPLPRPRPDTSKPFDPLPAPPPLVPPMMANLPQAAMFGVGRLVPGQKAVIPTDAVTNTGAPMDARMQSLISPLPPRGLTIDQIGQEADNARLNGYRAIQEMGPSSRGAQPIVPAPPAAPSPGALAGMGGIAAGASGVIPPNPNMPRYVPPALPRVGPTPPVVPPSPQRLTAPQVAPTPPAGGFDLGAALGGLGSNIQSGLANAGQALTTTASNAIEGTRNAIGTTAQNAGDLLKNELIGTVKGRTLLFNTALGLPAPGSRDPYRYGNTFAERQESARRREAMAYGLPYVPPQTGVRTSLSIRPSSPLPTVPAPRSNRPAPRNTGRWEGVLDEFGMII